MGNLYQVFRCWNLCSSHHCRLQLISYNTSSVSSTCNSHDWQLIWNYSDFLHISSLPVSFIIGILYIYQVTKGVSEFKKAGLLDLMSVTYILVQLSELCNRQQPREKISDSLERDILAQCVKKRSSRGNWLNDKLATNQ